MIPRWLARILARVLGYLRDEFCEVHGQHFEHPDHRDGGCQGRQSTRAEDLAVLAYLASIQEGR